ncbi:hypothetical protein D3H35_18990 [Cohnella faecalis]|uniref:Uncharacterized protein n=1 Tax=Cohnella faecalis TaxID=2315694 RepID=A0A398CK57_9BACL|nr:hypothetical protein D3H35_18990 [Cohnella faecalis]
MENEGRRKNFGLSHRLPRADEGYRAYGGGRGSGAKRTSKRTGAHTDRSRVEQPFVIVLRPSVSVKFHPATAVKVDVGTRQQNAGINMLLVEVYVRIRTEIAVVIPFDQAPESIQTDIPLSYALIVGDVPAYYYDSSGNPVGSDAARAPAITLPSKPEGGSFPSAETPTPKSAEAGTSGH